MVLVFSQEELTRSLFAQLLENIDCRTQRDHRTYDIMILELSNCRMDIIGITVCDARVDDQHFFVSVERD